MPDIPEVYKQKNNQDLWQHLKKPIAEITEQVQEAAVNVPETIEIPAMTLTGQVAAHYHVLGTIIKASMGFTDEEVAYYLLRIGIQREIGLIAFLADNDGENK